MREFEMVLCRSSYRQGLFYYDKTEMNNQQFSDKTETLIF